jgi:hypothetical protein
LLISSHRGEAEWPDSIDISLALFLILYSSIQARWDIPTSITSSKGPGWGIAAAPIWTAAPFEGIQAATFDILNSLEYRLLTGIVMEGCCATDIPRTQIYEQYKLDVEDRFV